MMIESCFFCNLFSYPCVVTLL